MAEITDVVIAEMKNVAPLNWGKAQEIGEKFGLKPRAIVASAIRNGVKYQKKQRVSKSGAPVVRKPDLVQGIEKALTIDSGSLDGLEKASKGALETLLKCVSDTE
jgi:hypothetical protein